MNTIVLGLDPSKGSRAAAQWTAALAAETGARVVATHVMPRSELWTLGALQLDAKPIVERTRALLDGAWTALLRKAGVACTTRFVRGDPATELLRVATRLNASMLVIGANGHSVRDHVVGGTVHKVINRSTVPTVLVPVTRRPAAASR